MEEIIKAFEHFVRKKGEGVILYNEDGSVIKLQDVVNLLVEQNAEIERLNDMKFTQEHCNLYKENEWLKVELKHQIGQNTELQKQVDEFTVKVKSFEMTDLCKGAYIEQLKEENKELVSAKVFELETKNTKLQKQVDELKEEMHKIESSENETYMIGFEDGEKKAVKDTAKEIFAELFYMASIHHSDVANILAWAKEKAKSKGVEVE